MNNPLPDPTPRPDELDHAIKHFDKPMEPGKKQELMNRLQQEKKRFIQKRQDRPRDRKRDRGR